MESQIQPMLDAVKAGDYARVDAMLTADPKLAEARDEIGVSAVLLALYNGHEALAQKIAAQKLRLNLFEAAALGQLEPLKKLVADDPVQLRGTSADGFPALHLAAFFGRLDCVQFLLAAGAGPTARSVNAKDNTALHATMHHQQVDVARVLLERGAAVNAKQHGGYTSLHSAAQKGNKAMVELLLEFGADPSIQTNDGKTAKEIAEENGFPEIVKNL